MLYLWLKALHLIAVVIWFAGLFYLPRLFVYHSSTDNEEVQRTLALMERRLYRIIMNSAVMAVFLLGFALLWMNPVTATTGWFGIKFLLVLLLLAYHIACGRILKRWNDRPQYSPRFYRIFNEVPLFFLILIVILAVLKPF